MSALLTITILFLTASPVPVTEPQALAAQLESGVRVVDLRGMALYDQSHVLGATAATPWSLQRGGVLRRQTLVLVDAGLPGGPAEQLAATLAAQGVRVSALRGGFRAWCEAGLPTSSPCGRVDVIPAAEALGRPVVNADALATSTGVTIAFPPPGPLPPPRPSVFWIEGGEAALRAAQAPAALGSSARAMLSKPSGSPIGTDASSCGCQR